MSSPVIEASVVGGGGGPRPADRRWEVEVGGWEVEGGVGGIGVGSWRTGARAPTPWPLPCAQSTPTARH